MSTAASAGLGSALARDTTGAGQVMVGSQWPREGSRSSPSSTALHPAPKAARHPEPLEHPWGKVTLALKALCSVGITNSKNCVHLRLRT